MVDVILGLTLRLTVCRKWISREKIYYLMESYSKSQWLFSQPKKTPIIITNKLIKTSCLLGLCLSNNCNGTLKAGNPPKTEWFIRHKPPKTRYSLPHFVRPRSDQLSNIAPDNSVANKFPEINYNIIGWFTYYRGWRLDTISSHATIIIITVSVPRPSPDPLCGVALWCSMSTQIDFNSIHCSRLVAKTLPSIWYNNVDDLMPAKPIIICCLHGSQAQKKEERQR